MPSCKHPRLGKEKQCKECGVIVDISPKRSKYGNRKVHSEGSWFDSAKEAARYKELKSDPAISQLQRQVKYPLEVNGQLVCCYLADFTYVHGGYLIVEDVKGYKTPIYRLKKKLMKACLGIDIKET